MSPAPQLIGRTIGGRFRVTGFIGEGAMAAVYRGLQEGGRDVAIKIMHPQLLGDSTFVGRFRREAKAAARLNHRNTVQIIDYGVDGRLPYIVMELVAGQDLFELLVLERRLSEARAARIMIEICDALAVAHEHGIVHRDLKPENVMIIRGSEGDRVKVLDFGIAKIVEVGPSGGEDGAPTSLSTSALTTVGMVVGTPAYMSPEQCRGELVDGRSDIYACGILLYLLVTGRLPFQPTGAPWEVAMDHIRKPPPAPSTFLPQITPGLEATILTALSKFPAQRQQTARELRDELTKLLPSLSAAATAGNAPGPTAADTLPVESIRSRAGIPSVREFLETPEALEPQGHGGDGTGALEEAKDSDDGRPAPPSYRADTVTRAIIEIPPVADSGPLSVARPGVREHDAEASAEPVPADVAASLKPPISNPASSEEPSAEIWEVGPNTLDKVRPTAAGQARPQSSAPYLPSPQAWPALGSVRPAPLATPKSVAPPSSAVASAPRITLTSAPQLFAGLAPPPRSPLARLVVPAAILAGVLLGVLAFFLIR